MRLVYFGSGDFAVPSLRKLVNLPHEVVLVVTQPDRPAGRGKHLRPTPVARQAEQEGLRVEKCANVNDPGFVRKLQSLRADLGVVAAFGQLIKEPVRMAFPGQCVNLHASLLPKYRGAAPIHHALLADEALTGVTVFRLVDRMDAGPILLTRETAIGPSETCGDLHDRLAGIACDAVDAAIKMHEETPLPPAEPQDESLVTLAPKLSKTDGHLRFDVPARDVALRCRAMTPWPGARCCFIPSDGQEIDISLTSVSVIPKASDLGPGEITENLTVATADGELEIHALQPAGKGEMSWQDFVNGRHVKPGDCFAAVR